MLPPEIPDLDFVHKPVTFIVLKPELIAGRSGFTAPRSVCVAGDAPATKEVDAVTFAMELSA